MREIRTKLTFFLDSLCASNRFRSINAKTRLVHDRVVTNHIRHQKRTTQHVSDQAARVLCDSSDTSLSSVSAVVSCLLLLVVDKLSIDCPGHDVLMATMLTGAAVMDGALLLVAANETCPQPQTSEHLAALELMGQKHILILQNKVDLIREQAAREQMEEIRKFVDGSLLNITLYPFIHGLRLRTVCCTATVANKAPIIPISAQLKYNIDTVNEYLCTKIPIPPRDFTTPPRMIIIRSFDVNKPGSEIDDLRGGVAGGSILTGCLRVSPPFNAT